MKMLRLCCALLVTAMLISALTGCGDCKHEWKEADCYTPKTCQLCGLTEGDVTEDHQWKEATTDAPKTCSICGKTEGERIDVDERFTTDACKDLFGSWEAKYKTDGSRLGMTDMVIPMTLTMTFSNDGELIIKTELQNSTATKNDLAQRMSQMLYEQYSAAGMNREQADAACMSTYGQSVTDFCNTRAEMVIKSMNTSEEKVYYVEDGCLFTGEDWGDTMKAETFEITDGGKLLLPTDEEQDQTLEFSRIATVK